MLRSRRERLDRIKKDLYNYWVILVRMPLLLLYASMLLGSMSIIVYVVGIAVACILGK